MSDIINAADFTMAFILQNRREHESGEYAAFRTEIYQVSDRLMCIIDRDNMEWAQTHYYVDSLNKALNEYTEVAPIIEDLYNSVVDHLDWMISKLDITDEQKVALSKVMVPQLSYEEYADKWVHRKGFTKQEMIDRYNKLITEADCDKIEFMKKMDDKMGEYILCIGREQQNGKN